MLLLKRLDAARYFVAGTLMFLFALILGAASLSTLSRNPTADISWMLSTGAIFGGVALLNFFMAYVRLKSSMPEAKPVTSAFAEPKTEAPTQTGFDADAAIARYLAQKSNETLPAEISPQADYAVPLAAAQAPPARPSFGRKLV